MLPFPIRNTVLFFSPHQDDELLTMGLDILRNTIRGSDVHVILCSDGAKSAVRKVLANRKKCPFHTGIHDYTLSERAFVEARDLEFIDSCLALGVKKECIHIPEKRMADGTLSSEFCRDLILHYIGIYGENCRVCTVLPRESVGQHPDHYTLGIAAKKLFDDGFIRKLSLFLEPYLLYGHADPSSADLSSLKLIKANYPERKKLQKAIAAYSFWNPAEERYAIGMHSMKKEFHDLAANGVFYHCSFERETGNRVRKRDHSGNGMDPSFGNRKKLFSVIDSIRSGRLFTDNQALSYYEDLHRLKNIKWQDLDGLSGRYPEIIRRYDPEELRPLLDHRIIVSFTSYPKRIHCAAQIADQLLHQTLVPDEIILWLSREEFPHGDKELPTELNLLVQNGKLSVRWCENLKSHKKYFYAMQEFKNDLIITVDDDLYYDIGMIELLFLSWLKYPKCISAIRTHYILMDADGHFMPYTRWYFEQKQIINKPSMELLGTSGAGMLFPPNILDLKLLDPELVKELCPYADDLWLKTMQVLSGVKVVQPDFPLKLKSIPGTQEDSLWMINKELNDVQLNKIKTWVDHRYGSDYLERKIFHLFRICSPLERVFYAIRNRCVLRSGLSLKLYLKKIISREGIFHGK